MILYFTGTGNSEYCARFIADRIGDECFDLAERIRIKDFSPLESDTPWVICVPTYAWRIPAVVTELLTKAELKGSGDVYFVMTCGGEIGRAEKYNKALCDKIGKSYKGTKIDGSIAFADALLEAEKVATVPGISFGADDCLRLSYSLSEADIEEGLARIKRFVSELV